MIVHRFSLNNNLQILHAEYNRVCHTGLGGTKFLCAPSV